MSDRKIPIVWITGASRGIGAAIAEAFGRGGAHVVLTGRNVSALRRNAEGINRAGGNASVIKCDVRSSESVSRAQSLMVKNWGGVDVLVNNAAITYFKPFSRTTTQEYDRVMATNLRGAFLSIKSVLPGMLKKKKGTIVNIVSVSATTTFLDSSVYSASKAGMLALSRGLRAEVRKKGIRIIDVLPGAVETKMWDRESRRKYGRRMMRPSDVADVVVSAFRLPDNVLTEEIIMRPIEGDL